MIQGAKGNTMIYVQMGGRCGNQLFRYASARYVSYLLNDSDIICDFTQVHHGGTKEDGWVNFIDDFQVMPHRNEANLLKTLILKTSLKQKLLIGLRTLVHLGNWKKSRQEAADCADRMQELLNKNGIFWNAEGITRIFPNQKHPAKNQFVLFMSEYAPPGELRSILLEELQPKYEVLPANQKLLEQIVQNRESVCISVRRGDFFSTKNIKKYGVCNQTYYQNAIAKMNQLLANPVYFVFSDDIHWCRQQFHSETSMVFIPQDMPVYETLRLMYSCSHFIISNSTFSWWGQYLGRNPDKIVISPRCWNGDGYHSRLIQTDWIFIDNR